jgi:hypothetical protein
MLGLLILDGRSARIRLHRSTGSAAAPGAPSDVDIEIVEDMSMTDARRIIT